MVTTVFCVMCNQHVRINLHNEARACEILSAYCGEHLRKVAAVRSAVACYDAARAAVVMAIHGCLATAIADFARDVCAR